MGTSVAKLQTELIQTGDTIIVVTRTTRYSLKAQDSGGFFLTSGNPQRAAGIVEIVGAMAPNGGGIGEGVLETGKYMVYRYLDESETGVKTSLVLRIEIEVGK